VTTAPAAQISPPLDSERNGDFFVCGGLPPRDHGPGGGPGDLPPPSSCVTPPGRLSRRVSHILNTNAPGSRLAPFLYPEAFRRGTGDGDTTNHHLGSKGTA
jgi:hypothetical protein